ncbi:7010_t:CDS:2 [Diversispora eburnea]|uniref:7010_t:CDS:1 n=1 Tax=Diversispora eburnea TaxID=1213867 RepID=A0A9N8YIF6_9GLOM|nr:7010_t:CDS:2 [Diversispora eburnea]
MSRNLLSILAINNIPLSSLHNTDEEDLWSETSGDTVDSWASNNSKTNEDKAFEETISWEDEVLQSVDDLEEKRTSIRENALAKLIRLLSRKFSAYLLESRRQSLLDLLIRSIKKDKNYKENVLAAKVLALLFITFGEGHEEMFQEVVSILKYIIINTASPEVKSVCIKTLGLSCFIAGSKYEAIDLLNFLSDIIRTSGASVNAYDNAGTITSALNTYGLIFSELWSNSQKGGTQKAKEEFERVMPDHTKQLESSTMEVRVASGENIALMFETLGIGRRIDSERWGNEDNSDEEGDTDYDGMEQLTNMLSTLATDSNRYRAKADRKIQRSVFRDVLRTVEDGDHIKEKLKFKNQTVYFTTWAKIIQLRSFREILTEGLKVHFEENTLLQEIFEFVPPPPLEPPRSRPDSALSFNTAGSDTDTSISKRKLKNNNKRAKVRKGSKQKGDIG